MDTRPEAKGAVRGAVAVVAVGLLVITLQIASDAGRYTTQSGRSWVSATALAAATAALVAAGVLGAGGHRRAVVSVLPLVAAVAWLAPVWSAWVDAPDAVRSSAEVIAAFLFGLVVHLGLRGRTGRLDSPLRRSLVAACYAVSGGTAVLLALVRDPYLDRGCLANCDVNTFLVATHPHLASALLSVSRWGVVAASISVMVVAGINLARASRAARRQLAPVTLPLCLFVAAAATHGLLLEWRPVDDPYDDVLFASFMATAVALLLFGSGLVVDVARRVQQRRAVAQVAADVADAPRPGSLQAALRRILSDPHLSIAYWLGDVGGWRNGVGQVVMEPMANLAGRRATRLTRGEETVCVITHSDPLPELPEQLGPAMLLGLENERLQAGVLAHLADIRESRARIVEAGDAERRRLERDLHDGAQQQLLAVSFDLRLAQSRTVASSPTATLLADAIEETGLALAELRELAHGIYPAVLDEVGLVGALESFAGTAPLAVEVHASADRRWPHAAEAAAYFAVVEAIDDASRRGASYVAIDVAGDPTQVIAVARHDGEGGGSAPMAMVDRVAALGGDVEPIDGGWRVVLPCG